MIDPMIARLAGCVVCAGLLAALVTSADASLKAKPAAVTVASVVLR